MWSKSNWLEVVRIQVVKMKSGQNHEWSNLKEVTRGKWLKLEVVIMKKVDRWSK